MEKILYFCSEIMNIIRLIRPEQWVKNVFVFIPLFFSGMLFDTSRLWCCIVAFMSFCFVASSIYCLNDIIDAPRDKVHPEKCKRPIASGEVSVTSAYILMAVLYLMGVVSAFLLPDRSASFKLLAVVMFYHGMNMVYCTLLKKIAIVDVFVISVGFVLRIFAGGVAAHLFITEWIVLMTFLLALFMALAKRRDDVILYMDTGVAPRKNTSRYNLEFIDQLLTLTATMTMVCYIMYCVSDQVIERFHTHFVYITAVFVLAGISRYLQLVMVYKQSSNPTKILLHDRFLQLCIVAWVIAFAIIIYVV